MVQLERRAHRRMTLERPCKLYVPRVGRYVPGSTWNLSAGGALLQLDRPVPLEPGDRLYVGVAVRRREAVLSGDEMIEAGVVRVLPTADDNQALAVRFVGKVRETWTYRRAA